MSTANFSYPSTSQHFTIGVDNEMDEWQFDDAVGIIREELVEVGGYDVDGWRGDKQLVARFDVEHFNRTYREWEELSIYVTVESGYYQGAMFDIDKSEAECLDLNKTTQAKIDVIYRKIEKVLARHSLALVRVGTFSNGSAVYQKAGL